MKVELNPETANGVWHLKVKASSLGAKRPQAREYPVMEILNIKYSVGLV
jgi:hypothetical protein